MKRSEAIVWARQKGASDLSSSSTHFANINAAKDVWWLEIPRAKLSRSGDPNINLLLYDSRSDILHHLQVSQSFLSEHENQFATRPEKACIVLELSASKVSLFRDVRSGGTGIDFREFLKSRWT